MQTLSKILLLCLFCLALPLLSGCGGDATPSQTSADKVEVDKIESASSLPPAEQTEADKLIAEHGRDVILYYFRDYFFRRNEMIIEDADEERFLTYLSYFVSHGADVNAKLPNGRSPLHLAALGGNVEVAKFLVANGADTNAKDISGFTPLDYAKNSRPNTAIQHYLDSL